MLSVRVDFTQDRTAIADLDRIILITVAASVFTTVLVGVLVADRISRRLRTAATAARGSPPAGRTPGSASWSTGGTRSPTSRPPSTRCPGRCTAGWRTSSSSPPTSPTSCAPR
ncbi:hypothetical protein ACFQ0M_25535 [Kitasatospora aburaviensis]